MSTPAASIQPFEGQRVQFDSPRSFDEVVTKLRSLIGKASMIDVNHSQPENAPDSLGEQYSSAMRRMGGISRENFEAVVRDQLGESEFMLFHQIDHSEWLPVYGITRRVVRLVLGNPIIAITMMRDDVTAGLFAPVELLVAEEHDSGCKVVHVLPSSLIAAANSALLPAARELDRKLNGLVSQATGIAAPSEG